MRALERGFCRRALKSTGVNGETGGGNRGDGGGCCSGRTRRQQSCVQLSAAATAQQSHHGQTHSAMEGGTGIIERNM